MPTIIAVDAMGSDRAPKPEVEGAILAARHFNVRVLLVGRENELHAELAHHAGARRLPIEIVHAADVITMDDKAGHAARTKRDSSMRIGLRLVRDGRAAGFITAGNTGAAWVTAKMVLGTLPGVARPALAAVFPTTAGSPTLVLDVGANVDVDPINLEQFAVMGDVYFRTIFGAQRPRIGLLNIGEEETKGNALVKAAHSLLKKSTLNFIGNVEGRDVFNGCVDVIVCDGFVGNVVLKTSEGLASATRALLKQALQASVTRKMGYLLSRSAFYEFKKRTDYTEYGGAPLLGVNGVCIIGHGSSDANAIKNAIRVAAEFVQGDINVKIAEELKQVAPLPVPQAELTPDA